jgi:predicted nucleic acid-binding protein
VILYLDTSALVKLYVDEPGRPAVVEQIEAAVAVATVRVTYAEARAAFARKRREGGLDLKSLRQVVERFDGEWATYTVVEASEPLVRRAGLLAERHGLRGYDAIQLAAAIEIRREGGDVSVACFDDRLRRAARRERLIAPALAR